MRSSRVSGLTHDWSLLTPRGLALIYLTTHPGSTKGELAEVLGISERAAATVLSDLIAAGAVRGSNGSGRRLHYEVNMNAPLDTATGRTTLRALIGRLS